MKTKETTFARTKKGRMINTRLQFHDRITSMYSKLKMSRISGHFSKFLNNSKSDIACYPESTTV